MVVADAHIHLFGSTPPNAPSDDLTIYEGLRRLHNVEKALVVGFEGEPRFAGNNEHILELGKARSWIAPLVYLPSTRAPTVRELQSHRRRGAVGFALYGSTGLEAQAISRWPAEALDEVRSQRAIVSINAPSRPLTIMANVVSALEGCRVLVSHLGLPGRFASRPTLERVRECLAPLLAFGRSRHVSVKFSGLYAISEPARGVKPAPAQPFVDVILDAFGPPRVLWGSDFPPVLAHASFAQTLDTTPLGRCTADELGRIMGGNLLRLLENATEGE